MKAAVFRGPKSRIEIEERKIPVPGYGEVLLRVHACGVCHGDLMVQNGDFPFVQFPIVPGHEIAGVVEQVGPGVDHLKVGIRVGAPWLFSACGHCKSCILGDEVLCEAAQHTGMSRDGGFQDFMIARADYVMPLPDTISFADAAPLMCAGLTVYSGLVHSGVKPSSKVAVVGLGGLGVFSVLFARAMGARVAVVSSTLDKEPKARELGAEKFVQLGNEPPGEVLRAWDGGADIILQVAPSAESANAVLSGLAPDGTMVLLAPVPIQVDSFALTIRRQRIMGSPSGSRKELRAMLDLAASHDIRAPMTCAALDNAADALADLESKHPAGRIVLEMK
jgi:propanol-preferring alcohol dehydrogenase